MPDRIEGLTFSIPKGMEFGPHPGDDTVKFWLDIVNDEGRDPMERTSAFIALMQKHVSLEVVLNG